MCCVWSSTCIINKCPDLRCPFLANVNTCLRTLLSVYFMFCIQSVWTAFVVHYLGLSFLVCIARDPTEHMGSGRSRSLLCHSPMLSVPEYTLSGGMEHRERR